MGHLRGPTRIRRARWRTALGLLACLLGVGPAAAEEVMLLARGKPFADKRVATALQIAIDWPAAFKEAGLPADTVARIRVVDLGRELTPRRYDPKTALQLLTEAGYTNGLQAPLDAPRSAYALARAVARSLGGAKITAPISLRADTASPPSWLTIDPQLLTRLRQGAQRLQTPPSSTASVPDASLSLSVQAQAPPPETAPPYVVPSLVGLDIEDARALAKKRRLVLRQTASRCVNVPANQVIAQTPREGSEVPRDRVIEVAIASCPVERVPRLVDLPLDEALQVAADRKLQLMVRGREPSQAAPNIVIDQAPQPEAEVPRSRQVAVVLSTGPSRPAEWCVPNLLALTVPQAARKLADAKLDLLVREIGREHSSLPPGSIISQRPGPEDCRTQPLRPPRIDVVLSLGPALLVPELVGLTTGQARARYPKPPLNLRVAGEREDDAARGTIVDQAPAPGATMVEGDEIAVWLSLGPRPRVPDLIGLTPTAAEVEHRDLALRVEPTGAEHGPADAGSIVRQRPTAGAVLPDPPIVAVVLSRGPRPTVPDLIGLTPDAAEAGHRDLGLEIESLDERHDDADAGTIIRQRPAAGAPLPEPPTVAVVLSRGPRLTVPDLVGLTPDAATAEHRGLALALDRRGAEHDPAEAGLIIRQDPAAGRPLPDDRRVAFWLSLGPSLIVPDIVGLTPSAARDRHRALALVVETIDQAHRRADKGTIVSQFPKAGAPLPADRRVAAVLSLGPDYVSIGGWTAGALALLGTLVFAVRRAGRTSGKPEDRDATLDASAPRVRFNREYGEQKIEAADGALAGPAMGLRVRVDPGSQSIDGLETIDRP